MKKQITCLCSSYNFPHRLGGGKCNGREWAEFYFFMDSGECSSCIFNCESSCEVAEGLDNIKQCEAVKYELISGYKTNYPGNWNPEPKA